MSSIAPSSTSSFRSSAHTGRFSIPSTKSSLSNLNSNIGSVFDPTERDDASPTKGGRQAHHSPVKDCPATASKDGIIHSSEELCLHVPHPEELPTPIATFPAVKNWYIITVGQEMSRPTYAQAFAEYSKQYHAGHVEIVLLLGSTWAKVAAACFNDKYSDFEYSAEDEMGMHEAEVYAAAEKVYQAVLMEAESTYQAVLKAHGFM
ncbi:hypothetical protein ARMGADRAFT_1039529 [Armillaria gallica]|uniref:Uncharacterized protein n=1 Tax=Armillaria gallica TaxID=47427 RepID=A0A2H3CPI9_ARMGA|nr:hypothetical protein ARMGADRAFT_1039529 [Armillaria gallica]